MAGYAAIGSHDVWYARVKVDDPIARVCAQLGEAYADQNGRDYAAMRAAGDSGRSVTETGI